jgi:GNAT superfamily N-acetyltransferase
MPEAVLLKITLKQREDLWSKILAGPQGSIWIAEVEPGQIVGFLSICPGREERYVNFGEIPGLYLLKKYHSQGIGKQLFKKGIALLNEQGFRGVYLWVLKDNPSEQFYQRLGGKRDVEKIIEIDGYKMTEVFYIWENE